VQAGRWQQAEISSKREEASAKPFQPLGAKSFFGYMLVLAACTIAGAESTLVTGCRSQRGRRAGSFVGLSFAAVLCLIVTPVFYAIFFNVHEPVVKSAE
jgi:hypothetical protein